MTKYIQFFALFLFVQPLFAGPESVIGRDERVQILATNPFAIYKKIGLIMSGSGKEIYSCTGTLIAPKIVLTAGHCVVDAATKQLKSEKEFAFFPGMKTYLYAPFGGYAVKRVVTFNQFIVSGDPQYDVAILELAVSPNLGSIDIYPVYGNYNIGHKLLTITGYPGDKAPGTLWEASGFGASVQPGGNLIAHNLDTFGGQSGAALRIIDNGYEKVIGVHTSGAKGFNFGVVFTPEILNAIRSWIK